MKKKRQKNKIESIIHNSNRKTIQRILLIYFIDWQPLSDNKSLKTKLLKIYHKSQNLVLLLEILFLPFINQDRIN